MSAKKFLQGMDIAISILLSITIFVVAIGIFAFSITGSKPFYHEQFKTHHTLDEMNEVYLNSEGFYDQTTYTEDDLNHIIDVIIDYLFDRTDSMQVTVGDREVFSNQALIHMQDVKDLYQGGLKLVILCGVLMILSIAYLIYRFKTMEGSLLAKIVLKSSIITVGVIVLLAAVLGILMIIDFDQTFYYFHTVIFSADKVKDAFFSPVSNYEELPYINNLVLITVLQEDIFILAGVYIILGTVGSYLIYLIISVIIYRKYRPRKKEGDE